MSCELRISGLALVATFAGTACAVSDDPSTESSAADTSALSQMRATLHDPIVASKLHAVAVAEASRAGVPVPETVRAAVAIDRQAAEQAISGSVVNDNSPVYIVQMTGGSFVPQLHRKDLASVPAAVLTIAVDAASLSILDVHYDGEAPDLTALDSHIVDIAKVPLATDLVDADASEPAYRTEPSEASESAEASAPDGAELPESNAVLASCRPRPEPNGNYYALLEAPNNNSAKYGARLGLNTTALTGSSAKFVSHEMWYGLNAFGDTWVEVGVTDGHGHHRTIFWADYRPGNRYSEHYYPNISWHLNTYYQAVVQLVLDHGHPVPCTWNVGFGGHLGQSVANCPEARNGSYTNLRFLEAGIEAEGYALHDSGYINNWQELNNARWLNGWQHQTLMWDCPATIRFRNGNTTGENL
jgi:hypothetical protein